MKEVLLVLAILPVVALGQLTGTSMMGGLGGLGGMAGFGGMPFGNGMFMEGYDAPDLIMTSRGLQPVYGDVVNTLTGPVQVMEPSDIFAMQMMNRMTQGTTGLTSSGMTNTGLTSGLTNSITGGLGGLTSGIGNSLFSLLNSPIPSRGTRVVTRTLYS